MRTRTPDGSEDLLTIAEVSDILRVSYSTLRRWDADGRLTAERTPTGQRRYRRRIIEAALTGSEREAS